MKSKLLLPTVALLALSLSGCTGAGHGPAAGPAQVAVETGVAANEADKVLAQAEEGQDLGNGRPTVSYDGLMVRRRVVIAVQSALNADLASIRTKLESSAADANTAFTNISPDVLEPALLQQAVPELIVVLPAAATAAEGRTIVNKVTEDGGTAQLGIESFHVLPVLVHDLRFTIASDDPAALSEAVGREGIVSDALGNYETDTKDGQLSISYTGPLLGDDVIENVRSGIARPVGRSATAVVVEPRSTTGEGVDMSREAGWDPEQPKAAPSHGHGTN